MSKELKRKLTTAIAIFAVALSVFSPLTTIMADDTSDRQTVESAVGKYAEDAESASDLLTKFDKEDLNEAKNNRNSISYILYRTFVPQYINNLESGILANGLEDPRYDGKHVCNPNAPNNLISHNCNVPNFSAELMQNIVQVGSGSPITGGALTSAKSAFGIGVPKGIPGETVPVDPVKRTATYTALEIFGYDLPLVTYRGEWDKINKSTEAKVLTNFGSMEKVTMVGKSLWNGVKAGLGASIDGFSFNPIRWASNVFSASSGGTMNSIIDTSELNVIATDSWNRNGFNNTLYNVYVLTDNEVARESALKYMRTYMHKLNTKADESEALREVMALETPPTFTYDPTRETEESKATRERIMEENIKIAEEAAKKDKKPKLKKVPEPVMMTEEEQLKEWVEENEAFLSRGLKQGLIDGSLDNIKDYDKFTSDWNEKWDAYSKREFAASGIVVTDILEEIDKDLITNDYYSDPKQPISHYVCANPDGTPMRKADGSFEYLYTAKNSGGTEHVNPKCGSVRSPIGGGYFGNGWHTNRELDTRHISNYDSSVAGPTSFSYQMTKMFASINKTLAKATNSILNLSFSPILESLGITDIVVTLMDSFRDTMFFPLAGIFIAVGAFMMFAQLLKNRSATQMLGSIFFTFIIFAAGSMFLLRTELVVDYVEKVPTAIDNKIADLILNSDNGAGFCSTTGKNDGIRSAQCNVWNSMVFEPWVQAQFGTQYNNLYANGKAPKGGSSLQNSNGDLVGDAYVNLGGGKVEHNWALYQLSKMKSGTITTEDKSRAVGTTDPHLYKLVDLQAGPNNGTLSDSRFLRHWTGESGSRTTTLMMATFRAILTVIAIGSLGFIKIEQSLLFSLGLVFLPFMLLSGLTEKGRPKLKDYLLRLTSFFFKRILVVTMLSVLLRLLNVSYSGTTSYTASMIGSTSIVFAFILYRKELLELFRISGSGQGLTSGDPEQIREALENATPRYIKNRYARAKSRYRGAVTGVAGGAMAGASINRQINKDNKERMKLGKEIYGDDYNADDDYKIIGGNRTFTQNVAEGVIRGHDQGGRMQRRKTERKIRKSGFTVGEIYSSAHDTVVGHGVEKISNNEETLEAETLKHLLDKSNKGSSYKSGKTILSESDKDLLLDKKVQKLARDEAKKRREILELSGKKDVPINIDTDEAAKILDKRKDIQLAKDMVKQPWKAGHIRTESKKIEDEKLRRRLNPGGISNAEEIRKQIIRNRETKKLNDKDGGENNED